MVLMNCGFVGIVWHDFNELWLCWHNLARFRLNLVLMASFGMIYLEHHLA